MIHLILNWWCPLSKWFVDVIVNSSIVKLMYFKKVHCVITSIETNFFSCIHFLHLYHYINNGVNQNNQYNQIMFPIQCLLWSMFICRCGHSMRSRKKSCPRVRYYKVQESMTIYAHWKSKQNEEAHSWFEKNTLRMKLHI